MDTTPATLLEQLRRPNPTAAWEKFVRLYTPFLFYWAKRVGASAQEREDLVQDVLVTLLQKLPEFVYDPERSFRAWLRTIVANRWKDWVRLHRKQPFALQEAEILGLAGDDEIQRLWQDEYSQHVAGQAFKLIKSRFRPKSWQAFWQHVVCGRPAAEVAKELGASENAVFVASSKILSVLRTELQGLLD